MNQQEQVFKNRQKNCQDSTPVDEQHHYTSLNIFKEENKDVNIQISQSSKQLRGNNHSAALLIMLVIASVSILILILLILIMYAHLAVSINSINKSLHTRQKSIISTLNETEINGLEKLYSMVSGLSLHQSNLYHNTTEDIINTIIYGNSSKLPPSCVDIFKSAPSSASGYYRIRSSTHNDVTVYCDMTRTCGNITGGWTRVAKLDMNVPSVPQCPPGLCLNYTTIPTCRPCQYDAGCTSTVFKVHGSYSKICGKIIGYQVGTPDGLNLEFNNGTIDGIFLTRGFYRRHIWAFIASISADVVMQNSCPCLLGRNDVRLNTRLSIGHNYFCDTAGDEALQGGQLFTEPLWDGSGCTGQSSCCTFNSPPWFFVELPEPTSDYIELRICRNQHRDDEDFAIQLIDIYVQ